MARHRTRSGRFTKRSRSARPRRRAVARRRSGAPRKHRNNFGPSRLSFPAYAIVAAIGAAAAQSVPGLNNEVSPQIPVTYGAILGAVLAWRGRGATLKALGLGMVLGGGLVPAVERLLEPAFLRMELAPAAAPATGTRP